MPGVSKSLTCGLSWMGLERIRTSISAKRYLTLEDQPIRKDLAAVGRADQIVIFGFPADLGIKLTEQRPMTRVGVVSLTSDEEFILIADPNGVQKLMPKGAYLIDARMFPGNSGGPVVVSNPFSQLRLGGLVSATNRNLDYGIVTPVSQIVQTLERAKEAKAAGAWMSLDQAAQK